MIRKYEQKACDVLSKDYRGNRDEAYHSLIQPLEEPFSSINALELANADHLKNFMGHTCCQTKLNMIWRGKMAAFTPWWQIVLAIFFPILVPTITFTTNKRRSIRRYEQLKENQCARRIVPFVCCSYLGFRNKYAYLCFLGLCSYFVLVELEELESEERPQFLELIIWVWVITMICEEVRQLEKGTAYISEQTVFISSRKERTKLVVKGDEANYYVRFVYSFGIMYTATLYPNSRPTLQLLKRIFYVPYWQIYGEIFLDFLEGNQNGCIRNETVWREAGEHLRCPAVTFIVPVLGALYMFLTNIILINLLIAMFRIKNTSGTVTKLSFQKLKVSEGKNWLLDWRMRAGWLAGGLAGWLAGWRAGGISFQTMKVNPMEAYMVPPDAVMMSTFYDGMI
ncbi:hypothetical protein DPMN_099196 [Dreissena polymorpha]|uniref:Ion transport domain-containing protein n=1 Tax=Dreissena polymorpha TaxID=45954 RepID=A0A9D4R6C5_DREPO|nr:hypothetical protein DPMN_099196 [Dreissena polymorpha]